MKKEIKLCPACFMPILDEREHLIEYHNMPKNWDKYEVEELGTITTGDLQYGLPPLPDLPDYKWAWYLLYFLTIIFGCFVGMCLGLWTFMNFIY